MSVSPVAVVVGVGPGLGFAVALKFAQEGYRVALVARNKEKLVEFEKKIADHQGGTQSASFSCDSSDEHSVSSTFDQIRSQLGEPEVLVYNVGAMIRGSILDIKPADFEKSLKANCLGAFLAAQQVLPSMVSKGKGTLLFTGATASLRGSANFGPFAAGKFGLRALAQSIAREMGPKGVHVAHVVVDGPIDLTPARQYMSAVEKRDEAFLDPKEMAETYWFLHKQHPRAWTHEVELRTSLEKW